MSRLKLLLAPLALAAGVLTACGSPPQPLATAPPPVFGSPSAPSASASIPPGMVPPGMTPPGIMPSATLPTGMVPPGVTMPTGYPQQTLPTGNPLPTMTQPPATTTSPPPKGAPKCKSSGPTGAQILTLVKGQPGIPDATLAVHAGPYCSGSWQFTELELAGKSPDDVEPLLVVSTGKPAALTLIEAGTDVCSTQVQQQAPAGIRVRACGS